MEQALKKIRSQAKKQGYITEDEIFELSEDFNFSLKETEDLMGILLDEGFIILEKKPILELSDEASQEIDYDKSHLNYNELFEEVLLIEPSLSTYIEIVKQIPAPQLGEEAMLIPKAQQSNVYAKTRIILMFLKIVVREALYFHRSTGYPIDDCIQEGNSGLIKAIEKFEISPEHRFSAYAPFWIRQRMKRAHANFCRTIRLPVHALEQLDEIEKIQTNYEFQHDREPTIREIILSADNILPQSIKKKISLANGNIRLLTDNQKSQLLKTEIKIHHLLLMSQPIMSLEEIIFEFGDTIEDNESPSLEELATQNLLEEQLSQVLDDLPPREVRILQLRYGLLNGQAYTLEEVGWKMGVTRERIRQIEAQALRRLQHPSIHHKLRDYLGD